MSTQKKRLNLLIEREQAQRLDELARQEDLSISWLVRRAIDQLLEAWPQAGRGRSEPSSTPAEDPFLKALGSFSAPPISSRDIDEELYTKSRS